MAAPKNHAKAGGRKKGIPNKVTQDLKDFYKDLLEGEREHIRKALEELRGDDAHKYLMAIDKISSKVVPNKKDITSDGQSIAPQININENRTESQAD